MPGIIKRITVVGDSVMFLIRLESGKYGRTYTGDRYRNYANWRDLKIDDHVEGLNWKDEARSLIDGDSPVVPIG